MTAADRGLVRRPARLSWAVRLLLGGFPPWWKVRYDDEMRATLLAMRAEGHWRTRSAWDLLRGLVEAWLDPTIIPQQHPEKSDTRGLIPNCAWGLLIFVLAGAGFAKAIEDPVFTTASRTHAPLAWSVDALIAAAAATAIVVAVSSVPSIRALLRQPSRAVRRDLGPLVVLPVSLAVWAVTLLVAKSVADDPSVHRSTQVAAFVALAGVTVIGGACSTAGLLRVATNAPEGRGVDLSRRVAMVAVGAFTGVSALAVVAWLAAATTADPHLLRTSDGLLATPTLPSLLASLAGLVVAAILCGSSGVRALSSRRDAPRGNSSPQ